MTLILVFAFIEKALFQNITDFLSVLCCIWLVWFSFFLNIVTLNLNSSPAKNSDHQREYSAVKVIYCFKYLCFYSFTP